MIRRDLARYISAFVVGGVLSVGAASNASSDETGLDDGSVFTSGSTDGKGFVVDGYVEPSEANGSTQVANQDDAPVVEYLSFPACNRPNYDPNVSPKCDGDVAITQECLDGTLAQPPLYARTQNGDGTWDRWRQVSWYTCPQDNALIAAIQHEWSTLTPIPTSATIQPDSGWVYANVPTIAIADDGAQLHTATLLGALVDIRATPAHYTWMWGDGEQTVTEDPGSPYPNATLTHTYAHQQGDVTLNLETSWAGEYRINGGAWSAFGSNIASDSPPIDLEVRNPHSQLVACTTDGWCR